MKIPESAFGPMLQAVAASLPYSEAFKPVAPESVAIVDILGEIIEHDPTFKSLEGFMYRIAEKTDQSTKKQEDTRYLLLKLIDKLQAYESAHKRATNHEIG